MRLNVPWSVITALLITTGCERATVIQDEPEARSPVFDSTYHTTTLALLHDAFMRSDTVFCDSLLLVYDDTALARVHPDRVNDAFVQIIISHDLFPTATQERFLRLAAYAGSERMVAWHDFLVARWQMMNGDRVGAVRIYQDLLARFEQLHDSAGISSACRRLGQIYRSLGEFGIALPYLHRALPGEPRAEFRCNMLYAMGECHAHGGDADSVRWCRDRILDHSNDPVLKRRGDDRVRIYVARLSLDAAAMDARRTGKGDADALFRDLSRLDSLLSVRDPTLGFIEAEDAAAHMEVAEEVVRGLSALHRPELARQVIAEAERRSRSCTDCILEEVALYAAAADMYMGLGRQEEALRYQTLRADALARNETGKARLAVEQARQRAEFAQQQEQATQQLEQERTMARARDLEHRMQRVVLVTLIGSVVLFAGVLFAQVRAKRRMQLEELRTRLSRDLHDDIGSTLSSINILSTVARRKAEAGDETGAAASLSGISERTQRLMRNMSDIVWSVDPDHDSLEELLARMREFGAAVLEPKDVTFRFTTSGDFSASVPPLVKSDLYLLFKEAVNNAAKHAQATEVHVTLAHARNRLRMTITDNGIGLESGAKGNQGGGNGLRNMRARAQEIRGELTIDSAPAQGTRIELVVDL
ncbi:MAG: ATP-binding protein [Flavobacteriales bacterium]